MHVFRACFTDLRLDDEAACGDIAFTGLDALFHFGPIAVLKAERDVPSFIAAVFFDKNDRLSFDALYGHALTTGTLCSAVKMSP